jgi:hypothetical protein
MKWLRNLEDFRPRELVTFLKGGLLRYSILSVIDLRHQGNFMDHFMGIGY